MKYSTLAVAVVAALASPAMSQQAKCDVNECSNNTLSNGAIVPAFYICYEAMMNNAFAPEIANANYDLVYLQDVCKGFCLRNSRVEYDDYSGATWDICAGCSQPTVQTICTFCDNGVGVQANGVGVCSGPHHTDVVCEYESGDGRGELEEFIGQFPFAAPLVEQSKVDCFDLVRNHRPTANGASFDLLDGSCFAEYDVEGTPNEDPQYDTCKFVFPDSGGDRVTESTNNPATANAATPNPNTNNGNGNSGTDSDLNVQDGVADLTTAAPPASPTMPHDKLFGDHGEYYHKGKKHHKNKKGDHKKGKGKKGKKGKLGFLADPKSIVGMSLGGVVVLVAGTALFARKRKLLRQQSEAESETLLNSMTEHTPLMDVTTDEPACNLEELPPIMT